MKHFSFLSFLALVLNLGFAVPSYGDEEQTPLGKEMDVMAQSLKKLRKAETLPEQLGFINEAQKATLASLKYLPIIFKDLKDADQKAFATADYKRLMGETYTKLCELEIAYLKGDDRKIKRITKLLSKVKKEGHDLYTE